MPKACPYVMMRSPIVAVINHRICEGKRNLGIFLFVLSDNRISEDWFFAEGERFLSFWRCHRPPQRGRRWCCGVADLSICLKSDMPQHQRQVPSTGIAKRLFFMFFVSVPQYLSTEPFNPLKSYLRRFFDFLGGDRAFGEHSEHSDAATPNSLTPNL